MNEYDEMHDEINTLHTMVFEANASKNFFCNSTRQLAMEFLIEETSNTVSVEELLEYGFKGYRNLSDVELIEEIRDTIACWCDEGMDHQMSDRPYLNIIRNEIKSEIDRHMTNAVEKHMLK